MNIVRTFGIVACACMLGTVALAPANAATASSTDHRFVMQAAQGGMGEVADGKLALSKSSSASVRDIAQHMVMDHGKANKQLAAIAKSQGMMLPLSPDPADHAALAKQEGLSGATFNTAYLNGQVAAHRKTIALFKNEIASGTDPQLVAFAKMMLPTLEDHLAMITHAHGAM